MSDALDDWVSVSAPQAAAPAPAPVADDWTPVAPDDPKQAPLGDQIARGLGAGTRDAITGLAHGADIVYGPATVITNAGVRALNQIPGVDLPYAKTLTQQATEAADAANLPHGNPMLSAGIEGAASVIPTMGAGVIAKGAEAAPAAVRAAGEFLSAVPDVQVVSAAGGAMAGEAARERGIGPGGQFLASLAGGAAAGGPYAVAREAIPVGWRLIKQLAVDLLNPNAAAKRAGEALLRNSSDPQALAGRLQDAIGAEATPGVQPTTAQAVADPGLLAAQNAMQSTDPRAAGLIANRNAANNAAWQGTLDSMAPQGAGADAVQRAVRSAFEGFQGNTNEMIARATERAQQAIGAIGRDITPERAGAIIREAVAEEYSRARATTREAYRAVDPQGTSQVPTQPLYTPAAQAVNDRYNASTFGTPEDLSRILMRLRDTNHASLDQIDGIRRDLGDIAGDLGRSASDRSIARALVGQIDDYLGEVAATGAGGNLTAEQVTQLRSARAARSAQGETFERGAVGNVTRTKAFGEPAVPDSGVAAEFLFRGPGSPEAAQQFVAAVGGRPEAVRALQDYAATQLRAFATNPDGTVNPQRLARWAQDHQPILDQFPELNARVGTAMRAQGLLDNLVGRQERTIDDVQRSALGYFLGNMNPDAAVARILNSPSSRADFDQLLGVIGQDRDAVDGLRRTIIDQLLNRSTNAGTDITGNNLMSQAKFGASLDRYMPLLERVFSPEHIQAMRQIEADLDRQQLSTAAKALGSNTVQNLSAASLLANVSKGTVPLDNPIIQNLMRPYSWLLKLPEQRIRDILTDAMLDPALALRLVQKVKPASSASLSLALRQRAAALGIGVADAAESSEPKQISGPAGAAQIGAAAGASGQQPGYSSGGIITDRKPTLKEYLAATEPVPFREKMRRVKARRMADGGVVPSEQARAQQAFARNQAYVRPGATTFATTLSPADEAAFRTWVQQNNIPFDASASGPQDYDMRGYWQTSRSPAEWVELQRAGVLPADVPAGGTRINANDGKPHFPDYWKTPYHETFSNESQYAIQDAPAWNERDQLVAPDGTVIYDERARPAGTAKGYAKGGIVTKSEGTGERHDPVRVAHPSDTDRAGARVADASPGQKEAGNYSKGHITWNGLSISIETAKGGTRTARDGSWSVTDFPAHYGYLKRTAGADSEQVDVFFGDHPESQRVWIIDQIDPKTRRFDEHKCVLAAMTPKEARDLYHAAFSDGSGLGRVGAFTMMSVSQFKNWLKRGKRTKPLGKLPPPRSGAKP